MRERGKPIFQRACSSQFQNTSVNDCSPSQEHLAHTIAPHSINQIVPEDRNKKALEQCGAEQSRLPERPHSLLAVPVLSNACRSRDEARLPVAGSLTAIATG